MVVVINNHFLSFSLAFIPLWTFDFIAFCLNSIFGKKELYLQVHELFIF